MNKLEQLFSANRARIEEDHNAILEKLDALLSKLGDRASCAILVNKPTKIVRF